MDVISAINEHFLTTDENINLRQQFIAEACELHYARNPIKIVSSRDQYLYDDVGNKYLDYVSRITNVGHCNETVVAAACNQMQRFIMPMGEDAADLQDKYSRQLLETLPEKFDVVLFTNSGAEANDLALQMVRNYTGKKDIVVVDGAFHGIGNLLIEISPRVFRNSNEGKKPWVHVIPVPDTFRGLHKEDDPDAADKYFEDAKKVLSRIISKGIQIGGLICEPIFVVHGMLIPPPGWLSKIYSYIHELGGLIVADEIQCGMGRMGNTFWAFQSQEDAIPDIITVGKPMGNGYPIGAVITSRKIASTVKDAGTVFRCDPVGASVGMAVLEVMQTKCLMDNAILMGNILVEGFRTLQEKHCHIGDVRGKGLIVAVDIVRCKGSTKPAPEIAEEISNNMKNEKILVGCEGEYKNVLLFLPALCISEEDCRQSVRTLSKFLTGIDVSNSEEIYNLINAPESPGPSTSASARNQYIQTQQTSITYQDWVSDDVELQNPYDALD